MLVRVRCPNAECGKSYRVDEAAIGHSAICKRCDRRFVAQPDTAEAMASGSQSSNGQRQTSDSVATPQRIGRFEIRARVGAGAFGFVYRAYDPVLERDVALKVPRFGAFEAPKARLRFLREPRAAAQLRHPHIVPIYDAGTDGNECYIASAYIEGRTLKDVILSARPDFRRTAEIVRELADALDYAHRMGVVHRDVKPANVMIDGQGLALLTDFGLASLQHVEEKLTQDGAVIGTPAYMAPEQAVRSLGEVGPASDQYSLGIVLYELMCGEAPFSGSTTSVIHNLVHQTPEPPRARNPEIPRDLETICLKAIAKTPSERYQSCEELAADLGRWLADEPIRARRLGWIEGGLRWARRNRAVAALLASVVMVTAIGLLTVIVLWRQAEAHRVVAQISIPVAQGERQRAEQNLAETARQERIVQVKLAEAQSQAVRAKGAQREAEANLAALDQQRRERKVAQAAAEQAGQKAQRASENAKRAEQKATAAEAQTQAHSADAERQQHELALLQRQEREQRYAVQIRLAAAALAGRNLNRGLELLVSAVPAGGEEDLRGFEWYYLAAQCRRFKASTRKSVQNEESSSESVTFACDGLVGSIAWLDSATLVACTSTNASAWNVNTGQSVFTHDVRQFSLLDPIVSPTGIFLVARQVDATRQSPAEAVPRSTLQVRRTNDGKQTIVPVLEDCLTSGVFSPDHDLWAVLRAVKTENAPSSPAEGRCIEIYNLKSGRRICVIRWTDQPGVTPDSLSMAFSPDSKLLATPGELWDVETGQPVRSLQRPAVVDSDQKMTILGFSSNGERLLGTLGANRLGSWELADGSFESICELNKDVGEVRGVNCVRSPDGQAIAVWPRFVDEQKVKPIVLLLDGRTFGVRGQLTDHKTGVTAMAFSPDGKCCVTGGGDNTLSVWSAHSGRQVFGLTGSRGGTTCLAFSPDGSVLARADKSGVIRLWRALGPQTPFAGMHFENRQTRDGSKTVVVVAHVVRGSPADQAGIGIGDVITHVRKSRPYGNARASHFETVSSSNELYTQITCAQIMDQDGVDVVDGVSGSRYLGNDEEHPFFIAIHNDSLTISHLANRPASADSFPSTGQPEP